MSISDAILGKPLRTSEEKQQKVGPIRGIAVLGLDALSSAAYGPEAALTALLPLGIIGLHYIGPVTIAILALLTVLYLSYRQVIEAYPNGGGAYTVASETFGSNAALLAASALLLDYVLNVAVGIAAGVGALVSAVPSLHPHMLPLCLAILAVVTVINLRGTSETGWTLAIPTYVFIICLLTTLGIGIAKVIISGGHPAPVIAPPSVPATIQVAGIWLLLRTFSNGCTAMTGVEAISNGVTIFSSPQVEKAKRSLTGIIAILGVFLAAISYLCGIYHVTATAPNTPQYQSVLSTLTGAIVGRGFFYYLTMASVLTVLSLSANTSFAGFPRLCKIIAQDGYLPQSFTDLGRRLVYSSGIMILAVFAAILLIVFHGVTDRLIPLFAIGALGAFTTTQSGMVWHWKRALKEREKDKDSGERAKKTSAHKMWIALGINAFGAIATFAALCIVLVTKFAAGAWIVIVVVPILLLMFRKIRAYNDHIKEVVSCPPKLEIGSLDPPIAVVPFKEWDEVAKNALLFALKVSDEVIAVHVDVKAERRTEIEKRWADDVQEPAKRANLNPPQLETLEAPYRNFAKRLLEFVERVKRDHPNKQIAVIIPELVQRKWYAVFLHRQRAAILKAILLFQGDDRVIPISVPLYLD